MECQWHGLLLPNCKLTLLIQARGYGDVLIPRDHEQPLAVQSRQPKLRFAHVIGVWTVPLPHSIQHAQCQSRNLFVSALNSV